MHAPAAWDDAYRRLSSAVAWRAVDQDGDVIEILVQPRRDGTAAARFLSKLLKNQGREPLRMVTDKLGSYRVARREIMPSVAHDTSQYANNRAEVSHPSARASEGTRHLNQNVRCAASNLAAKRSAF